MAEVDADGTIVLMKAEGTGGVVNTGTVTEQLLHEINDPRCFLTPDVVVDWTTIQLEDLGGDRVRLWGIRGAPAPGTLKLSITYRDGWRTILMWPYTWPHAMQKAQAAVRKIEHTVQRLGLRLEATRCDIFGTGAIHGRRLAESGLPTPEPVEVFVRFAARGTRRADIERLAAQQAPMHKGPPGLAGHIAAGKGPVTPIYSHWPTVVPITVVTPCVAFVEAPEVQGATA